MIKWNSEVTHLIKMLLAIVSYIEGAVISSIFQNIFYLKGLDGFFYVIFYYFNMLMSKIKKIYKNIILIYFQLKNILKIYRTLNYQTYTLNIRVIEIIQCYFVCYTIYIYIINVSVRVSLRAPRLILRALKLNNHAIL
jgi:hypothetical protein